MEAKELRIGHYYQEIEFGRVGRMVRWLSASKVRMKLDKSTLVCHYEEFEPIPLTEEWMKKFGAKPFPSGDIEINGMLFQYAECQKAWVQINTLVYIYHVHQLQNLYFALTGEELQIKVEA